jgi:hypothetical protein
MQHLIKHNCLCNQLLLLQERPDITVSGLTILTAVASSCMHRSNQLHDSKMSYYQESKEASHMKLMMV